MSDDILDRLTRRPEHVPLWEWKLDWFKNIDELTPYFIALLHYPYGGFNSGSEESWKHRDIKYSPYAILKKKCFEFMKVITEAVAEDKLPARTIDFYEHDWKFPVLETPGLNRLEYLAKKQGKPKSSGYKPLMTPLIHRDAYAEWLYKREELDRLEDDSPPQKWLVHSKFLKIEPIAPPLQSGGSVPDKRKNGRDKTKDDDTFRQICEELGLKKDNQGLYIVTSVKALKAAMANHPSRVFSHGLDDYWKSEGRRKIAINPEADRYRPKG